jgi:hypothetical protein
MWYSIQDFNRVINSREDSHDTHVTSFPVTLEFPRLEARTVSVALSFPLHSDVRLRRSNEPTPRRLGLICIYIWLVYIYYI